MKYRKFQIEVEAKYDELITFNAPENLSQLTVQESFNVDHIIISAIESFSDVATLTGYSKKRMDKEYRIMLLRGSNVIEYTVDYEPKIYYLGEVKIHYEIGGAGYYSCYGIS